MDPQPLLTDEECASVLENALKQTTVNIKSIDIKPLSSTSEGFLGEHFIVTIEYVDNEINKTKRFFLKQLSKFEGTMYEMAVSIKAYVKEDFLYNVFLGECKKYHVDISFAPRPYLCKSFKFVLEDLSARGFKNTPKKETLDLAHMKIALETLAKFHGASIACEERATAANGKPFNFLDVYGDKLEEILFSRQENLATKWFRCSVDGLLRIIDIIPEDGVPRETFKAKLRDAVENLYELVQPSKKYRNTVCHGDLWTNNFMFRYRDDIPVDCILIDYQLLKYSPPALDVVQMIHTNTRRVLREHHNRELLDHYHSALTEALENADLDVTKIVSKDEFLESSYLFKIPAKLQAIADRSITFLSDECLADAVTNEETFKNFLFHDRSHSMIESFTKNEQFRLILAEDILELRDLLMNFT